MKISIITITYNSDKTLQETIDSIASQKYEDIEYIIVDGLSNDNTIDIINSNKTRISKFISEKDNGIYDAMNKGLSMASGEIIGILNSDDVYANENVICDVVEQFKKTSADSLYADLVYTKSNDLTSVIRYWKSGKFNRKSFLFGWMPPHPTFFVNKGVYEKYGKFRTDLSSAADYELMLRFLFKNQISTTYLNKIIIKMREGGFSNQNLNSRFRGNKQDKMAWKTNNLSPYFFTLLFKPLRKISQFLIRPKASKLL